MSLLLTCHGLWAAHRKLSPLVVRAVQSRLGTRAPGATASPSPAPALQVLGHWPGLRLLCTHSPVTQASQLDFRLVDFTS